MNIGKFILDILEYQGRDRKSVAEKISVPYRTFLNRLDNDGLSAKDLLNLSILLDLDLTVMTEMQAEEFYANNGLSKDTPNERTRFSNKETNITIHLENIVAMLEKIHSTIIDNQHLESSKKGGN
jgi:uncharacterized protein YtpQ (UPF0354 family)